MDSINILMLYVLPVETTILGRMIRKSRDGFMRR